MKKLLRISLVAAIAMLFAGQAVAQKHVHRFIDQMKKQDSYVGATVPGWLIRMGTRIADLEAELSAEEKGILDIANGIKKVRVAVINEGNVIEGKHINKLIDLSKKDGLVEYLRVKDGKTRVYVLIDEKRDRIRNLNIIANTDDECVVVSIKTNISMKQLEDARFSFHDMERASD